MDLDLTGRVAIVTGGSDGLGKSTAKRLALEGAKVVICARREENLMNSARDLCEETDGNVIGIKADVSSRDDCSNLIEETIKRLGRIDILVNNAGSSLSKGLEELNDDQWYQDLDLKLMAEVRMNRIVIP